MHSCGRVVASRCTLALGVLGLVVTASGAQAQSALPTPGTLDVTPFFGFAFGSDQEGPTTTIGGAVGYNWTDQIAFEGELGIVPDIEGDVSETDIGMLTLSANGLYHFDIGNDYVPYATFGSASAATSYDFPDDTDDSRTRAFVQPGWRGEEGHQRQDLVARRPALLQRQRRQPELRAAVRRGHVPIRPTLTCGRQAAGRLHLRPKKSYIVRSPRRRTGSPSPSLPALIRVDWPRNGAHGLCGRLLSSRSGGREANP